MRRRLGKDSQRALTDAAPGPMLAAMFPISLDPWPILLLALAFDAILGDPRWLYRAVPHPVALCGRAIAALERRWNGPSQSRRARVLRGAGLTALMVIGAGSFGWTVSVALADVTGAWVIEAVLASTLIAGRGLYDGVRKVAAGLALGLEEGRAAVGHVVGRDPDSLDGPGVARAAIESTAENFSDGVVAPVFWFAVLGLGGLAAYKALNTLDSMIGYRSPRYESFGKAAARLDDAANWIPARLGALILVAAAVLVPGASAGQAWRAMWRDGRRHGSPNAGWPEAALAGALGFALGGPRHYGGVRTEDSWMGSGRTDLDPHDIDRALRLYLAANAVLAGGVAVAVLV